MDLSGNYGEENKRSDWGDGTKAAAAALTKDNTIYPSLGDYSPKETAAGKAAITSAAATATEDAAEDVKCLYVLTPFNLYQFELKNHIFDNSYDMREKPPLIPTADIDFKRQSYPVFMGLANSESGIYLVGGECYDESRRWATGCSNKVFKFNPGENCLESIQPMKYPKTHPLVEVIAGKIYVLPKTSCYGIPLPLSSSGNPPFEVLDTSNADSNNTSWEELPCPPFYYAYSPHTSDRVAGHFVLGHMLYVLTRKHKLYYFDTTRDCWGSEEDMFKDWHSEYNGVPSSLPIPIGGRMVSEDIIIALNLDWDYNENPGLGLPCKLEAYFYSKDGHLLALQNLGDVFPVKLYGYSFHLIAMKNAKFCALVEGANPELPNFFDRNVSMPSLQIPMKRLAVSIFSVKKLKQVDANAIQAKAANKHPPLASAGIMDPSPSASVDPEIDIQDQFLSVNIEKQYIFPIADPQFRMEGAFFA